MMVYVVEVCGCKERGTLEFAGVFSSEVKADEWAQAQGWQDSIAGDGSFGEWRLDYYEVQEVELDPVVTEYLD